MSSTQIIECAPCYELKYDEKLDNLRDLTFPELKIQYGKDNKIKCNCWGDRTREYKADSSFVSAHMKSQRHVNWREEQIKKHKQEYGHCISSEKKIETLAKENREYKKQIMVLTKIITDNEEKTISMSTKIDTINNENETLKDENETLKDENETLKDENETLKKELEKYEQDIINLTKEKDKLQYEISTYKLANSSKKKLTIKPSTGVRPFR